MSVLAEILWKLYISLWWESESTTNIANIYGRHYPGATVLLKINLYFFQKEILYKCVVPCTASGPGHLSLSVGDVLVVCLPTDSWIYGGTPEHPEGLINGTSCATRQNGLFSAGSVAYFTSANTEQGMSNIDIAVSYEPYTCKLLG